MNVTKLYQNGEILLEEHLDAMKSSIEAGVNGGVLTADNLQPDSIGTLQLADNAITTTKIVAKAVSDTRLASSVDTDADRAVTTDHIRDRNVTGEKLAADVVDGSTLTLTSGVISIPDNAITMAMQGARVVQTTTGALNNIVKSTASGDAAATASGGWLNIPQLTVTITTGGRPVWLFLEGDGATGTNHLTGVFNGLDPNSFFSTTFYTNGLRFNRDGNNIFTWLGPNTQYCGSIPGGIQWFDYALPAGTYTYTMDITGGIYGQTMALLNVRLVAMEI